MKKKYFKAMNITKNKLIGDKIKLANNVFTRTIGLLSRANLSSGEGLLIVPCKSIHSIFMRFRFDAVFLDKEGRVVHIIKEMKAFRASKYIRKAKKVLELPAGTVIKAQIELGDTIQFTKNS